jgi:hypothetical protein
VLDLSALLAQADHALYVLRIRAAIASKLPRSSSSSIALGVAWPNFLNAASPKTASAQAAKTAA